MHALVIGISSYAKPRVGRPQRFKSLTGTASGAGRFASYLTEDFHHPDQVPLRTVRLLLSPVPGQQPYLPPEATWQEAGSDAVREAVERWMEDCDADDGNVALLYVAGHGVLTTGGAHWLFLSAAGNTRDPYASAVNLAAVRDQMQFVRAKTNVLIWDLCATRGDEVPNYNFSAGISGGTWSGEQGGRVDVVTVAARAGTNNYQLDASDGTLLSWALVGRKQAEAADYLLHTAAELSSGGWVVTARQLDTKLLPTMKGIFDAHQEGEEPVVLPKDSLLPITRPLPPPEFELRLAADPARPSVHVLLTAEDGRVYEATTGLSDERLYVPAGAYAVLAEAGSATREYDLSVGSDRRISAWDGKTR